MNVLGQLKQIVVGKRRRPWNELASLKPSRNPLVEFESGDFVCLQVPMDVLGKKWLRTMARNRNLPVKKTIELDQIGSDVWLMMDGKTPLSHIAKQLARRHDLSPEQARLSLVQFCETLHRRNLVFISSAKK